MTDTPNPTETDTSDHDHDWGDARAVPPRTAQMCRVNDCTEWAVAWRKKWRKPTVDEQISLLARMMEDIAIAQAMQIIHGPVHGLERARQVLGYPSGDP